MYPSSCATEAARYGWSRAALLNQIKSQLHLRSGAAPTNFSATLPADESELLQQMVKDPYNFEFLGLSGEVAERALEDALVHQLEAFLLELGHGFAFVGASTTWKWLATTSSSTFSCTT